MISRFLSIFVVTCLLAGCKSGFTKTSTTAPLIPSNGREWQPELILLPVVEFQGDAVTVRNIRNSMYLAADTFIPRYHTKTLNIKELQTVDYIMVPFRKAPSLAHTMLSFGFRDGYHLVVSVEARLERGEKYSALQGALMQYELMYVLGDERDLISLRTKHRQVDVYVYPSTATPDKVRALFVDVMKRVNSLRNNPEFYNTVSNNCTTNLVGHINRVTPGAIPWDYRVLLPGYSDELAYKLGLIDQSLPFEQLKEKSRVTEKANRYENSVDFSRKIRQ